MSIQIEVIQFIQRTPTSLSIRFARPEGFDYLPGQFITISLDTEQGRIKKALTISSSPTEDFLEVTKRLTGHPFSNALAALRPGDKIEISGPYGGFTLDDADGKIGMLSGGIGITPLRSIMKYSTDKGTGCSMVLIYSNRNEEDIPFREEMEEMQAKNPGLGIMNTVTRPGPGWTGEEGRIDGEKVRRLIPDYADRTFYICGPAKMVEAMEKALKDLRVPEGRIKREVFPGGD